MKEANCILYPSRLSITPSRERKPIQVPLDDYHKKSIIQYGNESYIDNFKKAKNSFILSQASKRKLMDSINSLYALSDGRTIYMKNGKELYNFKMAFITLTLPSEQIHDDVFIKKNCINQLLVELRKFYKVNNYIWKAELQKTGNIHFHILTDRYVDYKALRRRWNRILEKYQYVSRYSEKFKNMSLSDYHVLRNKYKKCSFEKSSIAYAEGKRVNWMRPNSVDIKMVRSSKDLAVYLSKYITKAVIETDKVFDKNNNDISNDLEKLKEGIDSIDIEYSKICTDRFTELSRELNFGRSWYRSYSLSKLKYINKFYYSDLKELISYFEYKKEKVKKIIGDYYQVYYFNILDFSKDWQNLIRHYLFQNARMYSYPFP